MRARLKKLSTSANQSFSLQLTAHYHSYNELHYHPEIELIYIMEGHGVLLVGDKIEPVAAGDLLMIGGNLPHLCRFDSHTFAYPSQRQGRIKLPLQLLTLHFNPDIFGAQFISLPENEYLRMVIRQAGNVLAFQGGLRTRLKVLLNQLLNAPASERIPLLMQLLAPIASEREYRSINPQIQQHTFNAGDETRLTKIYLYTLNNFHRVITLKEIAAVIYMVPNAFCRYFKSRTRKTYSKFLLEIRVGHACKLLKETDYSIVIISYESGFSNLSNFNRYFKRITGKKPLAVRKEFQRYL